MILDPKATLYGMHESLIIPIACKSKSALETYVGSIVQTYGLDEAFLISFQPLSAPNELEVWQHERSPLLIHPHQIWIDISSRKYRNIYLSNTKDIPDPKKVVIDHIFNRKLASSFGYKYVRLLHVSNSANTSSGRGGETVANGFFPTTSAINPDAGSSDIAYADPSDLLKMLDVKVGGFALDEVRDRHHWFY